MEAGTLELDQAVEELLQRNLGAAAQHLDEAQRVELSELLREALRTDPSLLELQQK